MDSKSIPMEPAPCIPHFRWAQNPWTVFLTIQVPQAKDVVLRVLEGNLLSFACRADDKKYLLSLPLTDALAEDEELRFVTTKEREVVLTLTKKDRGAWKHLVSDPAAFKNVMKTDWSMSDSVLFNDEDGEEGDQKGGLPDECSFFLFVCCPRALHCLILVLSCL